MSNCNQTFDCLDLRKFEAESIGDITVYNFFDVGQTFSKTCLLHDAKFYKMCRNSFGNQHFQTAMNKTDNSAETPLSPQKVVAKLLVHPSVVRTFSPLASSVMVVVDAYVMSAVLLLTNRAVK